VDLDGYCDRIFGAVLLGDAFCVWVVIVRVSPMLGVNATTGSYSVQRKSPGAEHWVGGSKGFAHPVLSKTHTRTSGVSERLLVWCF
jgi:hypothetical protein